MSYPGTSSAAIMISDGFDSLGVAFIDPQTRVWITQNMQSFLRELLVREIPKEDDMDVYISELLVALEELQSEISTNLQPKSIVAQAFTQSVIRTWRFLPKIPISYIRECGKIGRDPCLKKVFESWNKETNILDMCCFLQELLIRDTEKRFYEYEDALLGCIEYSATFTQERGVCSWDMQISAFVDFKDEFRKLRRQLYFVGTEVSEGRYEDLKRKCTEELHRAEERKDWLVMESCHFKLEILCLVTGFATEAAGHFIWIENYSLNTDIRAFAMFSIALMHLRCENWKEALTLLTDLLSKKVSPWLHALCFQEMSFISIVTRDSWNTIEAGLLSALDLFKTCPGSDLEVALVLYRLAEGAMKRKDYQAAERLIQTALNPNEIRPQDSLWRQEIPITGKLFALLGHACRNQHRDLEATYYFHKAIGILEKLPYYDSEVAVLYSALGTILYEKHELEKAREDFSHAKRVLELQNLKNSLEMGDVCYQIGGIALAKKEYVLAETHFLASLEILHSPVNMKVSQICYSLSLLFIKTKPMEAKRYSQLAIEIVELLTDSEEYMSVTAALLKVDALWILAHVTRTIDQNWDLAEMYYFQSISILEDFPHSVKLMKAYRNLGKVYQSSPVPTNRIKAEAPNLKAIDLSLELGATPHFSFQLYKDLAEHYMTFAQPKNALTYFEKASQLLEEEKDEVAEKLFSNFGDVCVNMGLREKARNHFKTSQFYRMKGVTSQKQRGESRPTRSLPIPKPREEAKYGS